jgi:ankyrin repeat protein
MWSNYFQGVSPTTPKTKNFGRRCGNSPTSVGEYPLEYASKSGCLESVLEMLPYSGQNELNDALCWAATQGHVPLVSAFLEKSSANPNAFESIRQKSRRSALVLAVQSMEPASVRMLLDKGADISCIVKREDTFYRIGKSGETVLHIFATASFTSIAAASEILDLLLKAGADLEARDSANNTPILCVGDLDPEESIALKLLMAAGANLFAENTVGDNLLIRACQMSPTTKLAEMLLESGADPKKPRTSDGSTPLHK